MAAFGVAEVVAAATTTSRPGGESGGRRGRETEAAGGAGAGAAIEPETAEGAEEAVGFGVAAILRRRYHRPGHRDGGVTERLCWSLYGGEATTEKTRTQASTMYGSSKKRTNEAEKKPVERFNGC